jgi:predicted kinase
VVVDAVFHSDEYRCLQDCCLESRPCVLLAIEARFETRAQRLTSRQDRPCTPTELKDRDDLERQRLQTDAVLTAAHHTIVNERSMQEFESDLAAFWKNVNEK